MTKKLFLIGTILSYILSISIFVHHWIIYFITERHNHFVGSILLLVVTGINALMGHFEIKEKGYSPYVAIRIGLLYIPPISVVLFIWYWLDYKGTIFYYSYTFVMIVTLLIYMIAAIIILSNTKKKSLN